jgi:hypothetical protein
MWRTVLTPTLFCFVVLLTVRGALLGQDTADVSRQTATSVPTSLDESTAGLITIYSNLGPSNNAYDKNHGWFVAGTRTQFAQWIAMPFHVKEDATITQIKIAMQHGDTGTNGFTMTLTEDNQGLPTGGVRGKWEVRNLPSYGSCCTLKVVHASPGIKVSKGEIYWVVAKTDSTDGGTVDNWPYTWNHIQSQDIATRAQPFVWIRYHGGVSAFAVYGTKP